MQHHSKIRPSELPSGQFTAVALVSNCRSDVALFSIQAVAFGLTSSALLITKNSFASKVNEPPHELTFGLYKGTRDGWFDFRYQVKLHSRVIKPVDVQYYVKRHTPFHTPLEFLRGAAEDWRLSAGTSNRDGRPSNPALTTRPPPRGAFHGACPPFD